MALAVSGSSVVWSAFRAGSLAGVRVRMSQRSPSGVVVVAAFRSQPSAAVFAARWARRLGVSVVVRRRGALWAVSVPVVGCVPFGRWPSAWWVSGGVRGVAPVARAVSVALL